MPNKENIRVVATQIPAVVESAEGKKIIQLCSARIAGFEISLIEPNPQTNPGEVEIHLSGASAKNSPFSVESIDDGRRIFDEIVEQLKTDPTGNPDKIIARARQAFYSKKKKQKRL